MWRDSIIFEIDTATGAPHVDTCGGTVAFETVEDAAKFVGERALVRLRAQQAIWDSFAATVESNGGALESEQYALPLGGI